MSVLPTWHKKLCSWKIEYLLQNHTTLALWQLKTFLSEVSVIYDIWNLVLLNEMKMCTFIKSIICFCANYTIMTRRVFILHSCWLSYSVAGTISVISLSFFCEEAWFLIIETFVVIPEAVQICKLRAHVWFRIFYKNSAKLFNFPKKNVQGLSGQIVFFELLILDTLQLITLDFFGVKSSWERGIW